MIKKIKNFFSRKKPSAENSEMIKTTHTRTIPPVQAYRNPGQRQGSRRVESTRPPDDYRRERERQDDQSVSAFIADSPEVHKSSCSGGSNHSHSSHDSHSPGYSHSHDSGSSSFDSGSSSSGCD